MLSFKNIEIDDIEIYNEYMNNNKEFSCENSFVNLLVWQCTYNNMIAESDGQLFIKSGKGEKESFRLPIGGNINDGIAKIEEYCGDKKPAFWFQEGERFSTLSDEFKEKYELRENRDAADYVYLQKNLAELSGKKYHSKRSYLLCEQRGLETILCNMDRLNVKGGAIFVDERAVAFTLGSPINNEVFDIHIEKALKDYGEGYTVINREFARRLEDYKYINREDDMGLEGLRKAKLSYKPEIILKKYYCRVKK